MPARKSSDSSSRFSRSAPGLPVIFQAPGANCKSQRFSVPGGLTCYMTPKVPPREGTRPTTPCRPGPLTRRRGFMSSCIVCTAIMTAPPLQLVDRTQVWYRNRKLSYFGGCDYLRLSSHPAVVAALRAGLDQYGLTVAASRITTGNHWLYERLERRLTAFFAAPDAVLLSNGYATNIAVAQALAGNFSHVLVDEKAHASLLDAAAFFDCPTIRFSYRDAEAVA